YGRRSPGACATETRAPAPSRGCHPRAALAHGPRHHPVGQPACAHHSGERSWARARPCSPERRRDRRPSRSLLAHCIRLELAKQAGESIAAQPNIQALERDIDALDEQLDDAALLTGKELIPQWI